MIRFLFVFSLTAILLTACGSTRECPCYSDNSVFQPYRVSNQMLNNDRDLVVLEQDVLFASKNFNPYKINKK